MLWCHIRLEILTTLTAAAMENTYWRFCLPSTQVLIFYLWRFCECAALNQRVNPSPVVNSSSLWECLHHLCEANTTTSPSVNFKGQTTAKSIASKLGAVWVNPDSFSFLTISFHVSKVWDQTGSYEVCIKPAWMRKYFRVKCWQQCPVRTKNDIMACIHCI